MATTTRLPLVFSADYGYSEEIRSTDTIQLPKVVLGGDGAGGTGIDANNTGIINVKDPVNPQDAVNKRYADNLAVGIDAIDSCKALSNTNIANLSGPATVDNVSLVAGDRLLLIAQADPVKNGVWVVQSNTWTRPSDFPNGLPSAAGKHSFIESGDNYASTGWVCTAKKGTDTVGTNALPFVQFSGLGEVTAGNGLIKSATNGNTISINLATNSGLQFSSSALDHLLQPNGSLIKDATGLGVQLNGLTLNNSGTGLRVLGLPKNFTVANGAGTPVAVDDNVTAANLNTLVDGPTVQADGLHTHLSVLRSQAVVDTHANGSTALALGDAVVWSNTGDVLTKADAAASSSSNVVGIVLGAVAANGNALVVKHGVAKNVATGLTPGAQVFLAVGGGLTQAVPVAPGATIISIGVAVNASSVDVKVAYVGRRASA